MTYEPPSTDTPTDDSTVLVEDVPVEDVVVEVDGDVDGDEAVIEEDVVVEVALDDSAELVDVVVDDTDADDEDLAEPVGPSPYDRPGAWYVVHSYAGYENKVKSNLLNRVRSYHSEEEIFEIVIPMEDVIEFKGGARRVVQKKMYPGYVLVRMRLDDNTWGIVRNTPGVTGFVGAGAKPVPLAQQEVDRILHTGRGDGERPRAQVEFSLGESVKVTSGPLSDFDGEVVDVNADQQKLKVLVDIFERQVPVELGFDQVKKLD